MTNIYDGERLLNTTIDTNVMNTVTASSDVSTCDQVTFYVTGRTGAHDSHVVTLQFSSDNTNFHDSPFSITGVGCLQVTDIKSVYYIRLKVTTAEGALSTSEVSFDPSRELKKTWC